MEDTRATAIYDQENAYTRVEQVVRADVLRYNGIPSFAWSRSLDKEYPKHKQFSVTLAELWKLRELPLNMFQYISEERRAGRIPVMDPFRSMPPIFTSPLVGVPCGGIGSGCINRGWRGDFVRWSILPAGIPRYQIVEPNLFALYSKRLDTGHTQAAVLRPQSIHTNSSSRLSKAFHINDSSPLKGNKSSYFGSFPLAWNVHEGEPDPDLRLICCQVSPVLPGEYQESCYPCCVFEWRVENISKHTKEVAVLFSWQNSIGIEELDEEPGHRNESYTTLSEDILGVEMKHCYSSKMRRGNVDVVESDPCSMSIATKLQSEATVTYTSRFGTKDADSLNALWDSFSTTGSLNNSNEIRPSRKGEPIGAAISVKHVLKPGQSCLIPFALSWDAPVVRFNSGDIYKRRYTRFFSNNKSCVQQLVSVALNRYDHWRNEQLRWQNDLVDRFVLPAWYHMALFNELYYVVDGGTVWVDEADAPLQGTSMGKFFYLEGHEYLMCNTYDVHFYASAALLQLWPKIQLSIERDFGNATSLGLDPRLFRRKVVLGGEEVARCVKDAVPHDLGNPGEAPWRLNNSYPLHPCHQWRDLTAKFVLQLARDFHHTSDLDHLRAQWPAACAAMKRQLKEADADGDGMIENSGHPDTTYDVWIATGVSAYTGGLWLAALKAMSRLAHTLNDSALERSWNEMFAKARAIYIGKLWNGSYFRYDEISVGSQSCIHADQLAGEWYALASGLDHIIDETMARSALRTILENNVLKFQRGQLGAVNGFLPEPLNKADDSSMQSRETWTGVTYALAATMIHLDMLPSALQVLRGFVNTMYHQLGYQYATPEAVNSDGSYRSLAYMRPLSVWAVQLALEMRAKNKK